MGKHGEWVIEKFLLVAAMASLVLIGFIILTVFGTGLPLIAQEGVFNFLFGVIKEWCPARERYIYIFWCPDRETFGIFPMMIGTLLVTLLSMLISVPLAILVASFLAEVAPSAMRNTLRPAVELLAGIPSVVYGFVGLMVLVPFIRIHFEPPGFSLLAGSIVLAIMALPTIITISEDAIRAVPKTYKEASLALGATHWQTIKNMILPAARSGILAGAVLGSGRAIGETMAVIMVLGNVVAIPDSVFDPIRTLTANIALEMGYAPHGPHRQALFATGIVLFVMTSILIIIARRLMRGQQL
jgi:phosphate transport system permease protein